ncbi:MAG: glycosyltransferase family 25 protein [Nanoarchaeota archaeon]|nr:glycosyltransferase family 25 protein [Nanoarchaeota archaeon]
MKRIKMIEELKNLINERRIKIFIINYLPLEKRRAYLQKKIKELDLENYVEWVIQKPEEYQKEVSSYIPNKKKWEEMSQIIDVEKFRELRKPDMNLTMNYLKVYNKIVNEKISIALIFEDDVIMEKDFLKRLTKTIKVLPKKFDVAYTDAGIHFRFGKKINKLRFYEYDGPSTRTTASHFISLSGAKKMKDLLGFIMPIDIEMRYYEKTHGLKVYWLKGYLTYQGSVFGDIYPTTLQVKKKSGGLIQNIISNVEKRRFKKDLISQINIFLVDYLVIKPYRTIRIFLKKY